jgi:hypothetical protein
LTYSDKRNLDFPTPALAAAMILTGEHLDEAQGNSHFQESAKMLANKLRKSSNADSLTHFPSSPSPHHSFTFRRAAHLPAMAAPELIVAQFLRDQVIFRRALDEDEMLVSTAGTTQAQFDTAAAKVPMTGPPRSSEPQAVLLGDVGRRLQSQPKDGWDSGEKKETNKW